MEKGTILHGNLCERAQRGEVGEGRCLGGTKSWPVNPTPSTYGPAPSGIAAPLPPRLAQGPGESVSLPVDGHSPQTTVPALYSARGPAEYSSTARIGGGYFA